MRGIQVFFFLMVFLFPILASGAEVQVLKLEGTVLFPNREPLRQIAKVEWTNHTAKPIRCKIAVKVEGAAAVPELEVEIPAGTSTQQVLVPDIKAPSALVLQVKRAPQGEVLAERRQLWQPQRHWKVYIMKSSHEDLGYETPIYEKVKLVSNFIDSARRLSGPRDNGVPNYHYTMEHLMFQRYYIEDRSEAAWREIIEKQVKTGRMGLLGAPHGDHSHWMDYEELARMTYPGRREAKDRFGLDLKTFMVADNPSVSWSGCQALADAGFKYVARWGQPWRTNNKNDYQTTKLPAVFWWVAPNGKSRVLFAWRSGYGMTFWFGQSGGYGGLNEVGAENVNRQLQGIQSGRALGPYPYDALVNPEYTDHEIPFSNAGALQAWAGRYRYPQIRDASPEEFFEYIEKKYGDEIPSLTGDLNNFSADYATIDPTSMGWKRRAARVLPLAEGLGAVAGLQNPAFAPPASLIERTFTRLFDYDEHCWPTLPAASDMQLFNAQWVKQREAERALDGAAKALDESFGALAGNVPTGKQPLVMVFNPLAHARTDIVETAIPLAGLVDAVTGKTVPLQKIDGGKTVFLARDVPAFGYKLYQAGKSADTPAPAATLTATADTLENEYYQIRFDPRTGTIRSIVDKELKRELVDQDAARRFNEVVLVHKDRPPDFYGVNRDHPGDFMYAPVAAKSLQGHVGPLRAEMTARIEDPKIGGTITQTVILYGGLKRIDIINDLRSVRILFARRYEERYRDNLYYAFPVKVDRFEARAEYPGGVVRPYKDQLRWGSHDYLMANRWVDVSNSTFGVTMAPEEAPTVSFGEPRYNKFSIDYQPTLPHLYSYAYSNRMGDLLTLNPDDCNATLHYAFTSHPGDWNGGEATRFGWAKGSPLEARLLPAGQKGSLPEGQASFLSLSAPNVQLVTLKQSTQPGRGWIARLVETEGKPADIVLDVPHFPLGGAMACDLVENDKAPLTVQGNKVRLNIGPYAFATVRLFAREPAPGAVQGLGARAVSDKSVLLRWNPVEGAFYNVYRSEDPKAPPSAYSLVGRSAKPEYRDDGMKLDTEYYYHVASVTAANNQGPVAGPVAVRTAARNTSPPAPVDELGVVRRAKDCLIVYWRRNVEPDLARYYLYRGERPDFALADVAPVAVLRPSGYFLETYRDAGLIPGKTYYYRVLAEDWAGHRQAASMITRATTPAY